MLDLATHLKRLRKQRDWSQQKLAEEAGISYGIVTRIEQGTSKEPTIVSMAKLADALGVSIDELIGRTVHHRSKK